MRLLPFEYSIRNLTRSKVRLVLTIAACAFVVLLVLAAASFVSGMTKSLMIASDYDNVLLLSAGSEESLERSQMPLSVVPQVEVGVPGIKTTAGVPYVSPEIDVALIVRTERESPHEHRALLRGFTPQALLVHPRVQIVKGRMPDPGKNEIMVGRLAGQMMGVPPEEIEIGHTLWFDDRSWNIVGRFQALGTVMDAETWVPLTDLQVATKRDGISCVVVTLGDATFDDVDAFTKLRLDLELVPIRESDYYAGVMRFYRPVRAMIWGTALLVALAGVLGGFNAMYAAFASRVREVGVLQALGYSRFAIVVSLLQESLLTAAAGALIACAVAGRLIDGQAVTSSMGVFELVIDHRALFTGLLAGLMVGIVGALPPAWRCLRLPITEALKAS